ncbi:hypothetical protein NVV95_01315 [Herbiconiux sp. CPCC 205716]|uniref:Uncharacterized protein n=1 Tax=Herbiconiux gentiana TaxID=2970912 RepID=A0ABT2GAK7_9MICO|nr:hypothetical protein [Herbiconiux gentiana]MCS5713183.1 hypothetical protein [Herbiconiux gentiana]
MKHGTSDSSVGPEAGSAVANAEPFIDPESAVRTMLALARISPSEEEISGLIAGFAPARAAVRMLYAVPEARYAEPALVFRARP